MPLHNSYSMMGRSKKKKESGTQQLGYTRGRRHTSAIGSGIIFFIVHENFPHKARRGSVSILSSFSSKGAQQ